MSQYHHQVETQIFPTNQKHPTKEKKIFKNLILVSVGTLIADVSNKQRHNIVYR